MAVLGVTMVVLCLAVAVNAKGSTLKKSDLDYQQRRSSWKNRYGKKKNGRKAGRVQGICKDKQFAEEVAKEKLGLVNPDEILLKPNQ